jgi:hypothetical protein
MQQSCTCGSVRGASGNWRPYRDPRKSQPALGNSRGSQRNSEAKNYCGSRVSAAKPRSDFHKAGFFRRCDTVFKISRESSLSDTARAMLMAPTIAQ